MQVELHSSSQLIKSSSAKEPLLHPPCLLFECSHFSLTALMRIRIIFNCGGLVICHLTLNAVTSSTTPTPSESATAAAAASPLSV